MRKVLLFLVLPLQLGGASASLAASEALPMVLEEIVVTAQKREQSIQEVPIAITAFDGNMLENNGATNLVDLNGIAPNVILTELGLIPNIGKFAVRGIAFLDPDPNADPKTGISLDGVSLTRNAGILNDAFDLERVEILRGPQGTLFGRNNLAGTINMVSARPTEEAGGKVKVAVGDNGLRSLRAVANTGAFADGMMRAKIAGVTRDYDGYYKNGYTGTDLGKTDADGVRGTLAFENGRFDATLIADYEREKVIGPGSSNELLDPGGTGYDGKMYTVQQDVDGFSDLETWGVTLESNLETDVGTFTLVANTRDLEYLTFGDFDARPGRIPLGSPPRPPNVARTIFHLARETVHDQQSIELRFADSHSELFDYVLGVFYVQEDYVTTILQNLGPGLPPPLTFASIEFEDAKVFAVNSQDSKSTAFFGQTDIHFTDRLSATVGGRITMDDKKFHAQATFPFTPPPFTPEGDWDEFTWKAGLNFDVNDDVLVYGTVSTGYKGGGYNARASVAQNVGPYDPETLTSYEAGLKGDFLDNRVRVNAAAFFSDYKDVVGVVRRLNAAQRGTEAIQENLGDAEIFGLELESTFLLTDQLTLSLNAAYLDAKWTEFFVDLNNDGIKTDNTHFDLPNAPKWNAYAALDYRLPVADGVAHFHIDGRYMSRHLLAPGVSGDIFYRQAAVISNAFIAYAPDSERFRVSAYCRNLTDEDIRVGALNVVFIQTYFHKPREFGVEFQLNF